jgi:hypothetical protein
MRNVVALLGIFILAEGLALAQPVAPTVPAEVVEVVSGGSWASGSSRGNYRAVIESSGFEHVSSILWLEWLTNSTNLDGIQILGRVRVEEVSDGFWSIAISDRVPAFSDGRIEIEGTHTYSGEHKTFVFVVSDPGVYRIQ